MQSATITPAVKRRPGRPPTYVFDRPDDELTENERRLRSAVLKRRERQNRSYRRRKLLKSQQLAKAHQAAAAAAYIPPVPPPVSQGQRHHHHSPQLPAIVRHYDVIPHPPPPEVSASAPLRPTSLFLPRLQPNAYGTSHVQRLPPTSSSISNAPPVLPPPHISASTTQALQSYDAQPYSFEVHHHTTQAPQSHSLASQHPAPPPPPPLHRDTLASNGNMNGRQETATITTGTLYSAPALASKSAEPIPDIVGPLNLGGEHHSRDQQSHSIGVPGGWTRNYEQCGTNGLAHERANQSSEPSHVHI